MQRIKNIKTRKFLIYTLKDPVTLEIRYVGVTSTTLSARLSQHIYDSKKLGTHKRYWIKSLVERNLKPIIETIESCTYKTWEDREKYWISYYENLTNTLSGGRGVVLHRTKESIQKSTEAKYKPLVAITNKRKVLHFKSHVEAEKKLEVPRSSIEYSLSSLNFSAGGYNFIHLVDYKEGMEKSVIIRKKKQKYNVKYQEVIYTPKELAEFLNISETTVYLWCTGKTNWRKAHKLKGEQIEIFKIKSSLM